MLPVTAVLRALHTLSEQSYENKALTFGCILDPSKAGQPAAANFPSISCAPRDIRPSRMDFVPRMWFPPKVASSTSWIWTVLGAPHSRKALLSRLDRTHRAPARGGRCGIALSRQGDVLVFDQGTLRFTYRYGRWQYCWNHTHLVKLLRDRARAQRVPRSHRLGVWSRNLPRGAERILPTFWWAIRSPA